MVGDEAFRIAEPGQPEAPPRRPLWCRRLARLAAVAAALVAVCYGVGRYMAAHRTLHVVNGLPEAVEVRIDAGPAFSVAPSSRKTIAVSEGDHTAAVQAGAGRREEVRLTIQPNGFFSRFSDDRVYVLNPFGAAALLWERTVYSAEPRRGKGTGGYRCYVGRGFISFKQIDYLFKDFPPEITRESGPKRFFQTRLAVMPIEPSEMVAGLSLQEKVTAGELLRYAEAHLLARPRDKALLRQYLAAALSRKQGARCRSFLAGGLGRRPVLVDWHRYLQELRERAGEADRLEAEYRQRLEADPNNSDLLYLTGRLSVRASEALGYMDRALASDPNNPYPLLARSFCMMCLGRFPAARASADRAAALAPSDPDVIAALRTAQFAARDFDALLKAHREALDLAPTDLAAQMALMDALCAKGDLAGAREAHEAYVRAVRAARSAAAGRLAAYSHLHLMELEGNCLAVLDDAAKIKEDLPRDLHTCEAYLALGRPEEAAEAAIRMGRAGWYHEALVSIGLHAEGKADAALEWRRRAGATLAAGDRSERAFAELLDRGPEADADLAADAVYHAHLKAALLVALVQAGADRELLGLAEKLNYAPGLPQRLLGRAIEQLRKTGRAADEPGG